MKQFFPAKVTEGDDPFVRYSHSEANSRSRKAVPMVQDESAGTRFHPPSAPHSLSFLYSAFHKRVTPKVLYRGVL